MPPVLRFYRTLPLDGSPPPRAPTGARSTPSTKIDNTAKYGVQDEAKLRSKTLNVYLTVCSNPLIYQR